jgi:hypothetical protein
MYSLLKIINKKIVVQEVPTLFFSLLTTELFLKLHSFTLECISFLLLWALSSKIVNQFYK